MESSRQRGFTLIELLVVIAIIGILASIILASLSTARSKGNDAKVQEQMKSIQDAAEIYYTGAGNYGTNTSCAGMTSDTASGMNALTTASAWPDGVAPVCVAGGTNQSAYAMYHGLSTSGEYWCVDSSGASEEASSTSADQC